MKKTLSILILCIIFLLLIISVVNAKTVGEWNNEDVDLIEERSYEEAIECYDNALEIDLEYALTWYGKGAALNE